MKQISCFISPHGYGHATRCTAVLESLRLLLPNIRLQLLTTVPQSLFHQTLDSFEYHPVVVDLGMVQNSALDIDLQATQKTLDEFLPLQDTLIDQLSSVCQGSSLILCDISPLGIAVGKQAGIPSVLLGNFTWDWIYEKFLPKAPALKKHIHYLKRLFAEADYRILTEPTCTQAKHDLACGPVFRKQKKTANETKELLGCTGEKLVVVTMGGFAQQIPNLRELQKLSGFTFLFTGQAHQKRIGKNIHLLPRDDQLYFPDIIAAADIVVCKAGYSTVAECYQAGARIISVGTSDHAEALVLQNFMKKQLDAINITPSTYSDGQWSPLLYKLMERHQPAAAEINGADTIATFLSNKLTEEHGI